MADSQHTAQPVILPHWLYDFRKDKGQKIYIYCLIDPFTQKVRYIGKSIRPRERLTNHMNERSKCHRTHWLQELKRKGETPIQGILEVCSADDDWQSIEKKWIKLAKNLGWPLVNGTDGGDGVSGLNEESRRRMAQTWLGRKHKPETLILLSKNGKGKHDHPQAWREHMSRIMAERVFTPIHRERLSQAVRKFSNEQVESIRTRLRSGERVKDLAREFDVDRTTISKIKMGRYPK